MRLRRYFSLTPLSCLAHHQQLGRMLREDELASVPVLIWANKQDLPNAMSLTEVFSLFPFRSLCSQHQQISEKMGLTSLCAARRWYIQGAMAVTGEGLREGLDWISNAIAENMLKRPPPTAPVTSSPVSQAVVKA